MRKRRQYRKKLPNKDIEKKDTALRKSRDRKWKEKQTRISDWTRKRSHLWLQRTRRSRTCRLCCQLTVRPQQRHHWLLSCVWPIPPHPLPRAASGECDARGGKCRSWARARRGERRRPRGICRWHPSANKTRKLRENSHSIQPIPWMKGIRWIPWIKWTKKRFHRKEVS